MPCRREDRRVTLYSFGVNDIAEPGQQHSLHELSFLGALRFLPTRDTSDITILGVEPETIDYGLDLSPTLQAALSMLVQTAKKMAVDCRCAP